MEMEGGGGRWRAGVVQTNRVGFSVLVYPHSSQRECVLVCVCPPAHISFIGCVALLSEGPGQPRGSRCVLLY